MARDGGIDGPGAGGQNLCMREAHIHDRSLGSLMSQSLFERRSYQPGDPIIREGDDGTEFFYVESGKVEIWRGTPSHRTVLGHVEAGGIFGEMAIIDNSPRMASALAAEATVCRVIPREVLDRKLESADPLLKTIIRVFVRNIRQLSKREMI